MGEHAKVLGPNPIDASTCADPHALAAALSDAFDGRAVSDPGPGPDGSQQGVPVQQDYPARLCFSENFGDTAVGEAAAAFVDEYFVAIPGKDTIQIPDPTREVYHEGSISCSPQAGGSVVLGSGTTFPDWSAASSISFEDGNTGAKTAYSVKSRNSNTELILDSTSAFTSSTNKYVLKQDEGQLTGLGKDKCGFFHVQTEVGGTVPEISPAFSTEEFLNDGGSSTLYHLGTADGLILPGDSGDCTVDALDDTNPVNLYNASGKVVWRNSQVLVPFTGQYIISADSAEVLSASATHSQPSLITHFNGWQARAGKTFDETGISGASLKDPLNYLDDVSGSDTVIFSVGDFLEDLRFTVIGSEGQTNSLSLEFGVVTKEIPPAYQTPSGNKVFGEGKMAVWKPVLPAPPAIDDEWGPSPQPPEPPAERAVLNYTTSYIVVGEPIVAAKISGAYIAISEDCS